MPSFITIGVGVLASGVGLWAGYTALYEGRLDAPEYQVIRKSKSFEIREYKPFSAAIVAVEQQGRAGLSQGFRQLAGFIFGGNAQQESLAMTAPVLQQNNTDSHDGILLPSASDGSEMMMAFVLPPARTLSSIPEPSNERIVLEELHWGQLASYRFSGRVDNADFQVAERELREWLQSEDLTPSGQAVYAQYNSPSAFPWLRRNEVLIPINEGQL